jgi:catechol 2,3-dioxygenase-like lactoylglutathione lyase family enzyme
MSLSLDHLVILVKDLDQTVTDYTALGFTAQRGGTHADGSTHNALVVFADGSYLELISFLKAAPQHRWYPAIERVGEGLVDFALLPTSVATVVHGAQQRGLAYQGPLPGGRLRPDGERLEWQLGLPPTPDLPFLCGDVTPRALRVPEGAVRTHANGVRGVASVSLAVADLDASLQRYQALLGLEGAQQVRPFSATGLGLRQAVLPLGEARLVLNAPGAHSQAPAALALRKLLAERGEGVLGIALLGDGSTQPARLPLALSHGAPIEIVAA